MKLVVSRAAQADLARLHAFLKEKNRSAADRANAALIAALQSLAALPARGRPLPKSNMRELIAPFGRSFYVLRYAYNSRDKEVIVIRIWHSREARD
jgi:plasmid stabilization system protein ParE